MGPNVLTQYGVNEMTGRCEMVNRELRTRGDAREEVGVEEATLEWERNDAKR